MTLQLYVWHPVGTTYDNARRRVAESLGARAAEYEVAYGRPFELEVRLTDAAIVGTLGYDRGVAGGAGWIGDGSRGAVVVGAVEGELAGTSEVPTSAGTDLWRLRAALMDRRAIQQAGGLGDPIALSGRWAAAAWEDTTTVVVNGASIGLSLWWTDGPDGWAVGSCARVLLDLVGRAPQLDLDAASMSIALGYVGGSRSLFAGVHRFGPGERAAISGQAPVRVDRAVGLDQVLGARQRLSYADVVERFGEQVAALVHRECARSGNPHISLSGGRDSRLLAAAAVRAGWHPSASTGGPAASPDVQLGRQVAHLLGLQHTSSADPVRGEAADRQDARRQTGGGGRSQPMTLERLATWIRLSDGTAPAPLAWVARDLSRPRAALKGRGRQTFNGLGGEVHRGAIAVSSADLDRPGSARRGRDLVVDIFSARARLRRPVRDLIGAEIDQLDGLGDRSIPLSEWLARCYWRLRENSRGLDVLARADLESWTWAPLMNLGLVSVTREAPVGARASNRLIEDATRRLAPQLAGVPYDRGVTSLPPEWAIWWIARLALTDQARRVRSFIQGERRPRRSAARGAAFQAFWEKVYLGPGDHVWPELVTSKDLQRWIHDDPEGMLLKYLSVPELLIAR